MSLTKDERTLLKAIEERDGADEPLGNFLPVGTEYYKDWESLRQKEFVATVESGDLAGITVITPKGREALAQGEENG